MGRNRRLPPQPTLDEWAYAFVDTFQNNLDHLPDLADMIAGHGTRVDRLELAGLVNQTILAQSQERRVERVSRAIHGGALIRRLSIEDIDCMDGLEFEQCLCKLFRALGYQAQVTRASGDQGADLVLEKLGERTVVQAKRYADRVSNSAVQEVVAAKAQYGCRNAMVVTNSYFTSSAAELAAANGVALWDRDKLASTISVDL
jgi:HJR/Mrr/RecB family endonuclease